VPAGGNKQYGQNTGNYRPKIGFDAAWRLQFGQLYRPVSDSQLPELDTRFQPRASLIRIKALQTNALSRFQSSSVRFKLGSRFRQNVNDCQLGTERAPQTCETVFRVCNLDEQTTNFSANASLKNFACFHP